MSSLEAAEFQRQWIDAGRSGDAPGARDRRAICGDSCGAGHGGGQCIDEIDRLCMEHDQAYAAAEAIDRGERDFSRFMPAGSLPRG